MSGPGKGVIWLAIPGQSVAETINTYWYYCEKKYKKPDKIVLLRPEAGIPDKKDYISGFAVVADEFSKKGKTLLQTMEYKDEDIKDFSCQATMLMEETKKKNLRMIIDISSTIPGFIPVILYNLAIKHNSLVDKMYYAKYTKPEYRQKFYPLIPGSVFKVFNIFEELSKTEY